MKILFPRLFCCLKIFRGTNSVRFILGEKGTCEAGGLLTILCLETDPVLQYMKGSLLWPAGLLRDFKKWGCAWNC